MIARRNLIFVVGFIVLGLTAIACGGPAPTPLTIVVTSPPIIQTSAPIIQTVPPVIQVVTAVPPTAAPTKPAVGKSLTVAATWGGGERDAFLTVVDAFTAKTGIAVQFETMGGDNMGAILRTRVAGGSPPDVAFESRPGEVAEFATAGSLVKIDTLVPRATIDASFNKGYTDLGTFNGSLYGFVWKANSKSTFWYKPASFKALGVTEPKTLDELFVIADKYKAAGKVPFATGGKSGWPLTDYFENLLIRVASPQLYNDLHVTHKVAWTDPAVIKALTLFTKFFQPGYQVGETQGVLGTLFAESIPLFVGPTAKSEMFYEGGFVGVIATTNVDKTLVPGQDLNFFMFPQADPAFGTPVVGGGDVAIAFKDSPEVRAFMAYIISKEAADIFATTNTISPNKLIDPTKFPSILARNEYSQLANATSFVFDGSDLAPSKIGGDVEFVKLQELVTKPADVARIAADIEAAAKTAY
jgi:ABC-type glycerol-3-phosphate transport system substrate-binding protein